MKNFSIACLLLIACASAVSQERFSSVEERMTGKEFMDAGLNKLTDAELAALNKWLRDHSVATLESRAPGSSAPSTTSVPSAAATPGAAAPAAAADPQDMRGLEGRDHSTIVSRLVGEFDGWDGETIFELENGMVWQQVETDHLSTKKMVNPVVTIKSGMFSSWRLSVENYNKSIQVKRIQ